jgi:hypothetical protein
MADELNDDVFQYECSEFTQCISGFGRHVVEQALGDIEDRGNDECTDAEINDRITYNVGELVRWCRHFNRKSQKLAAEVAELRKELEAAKGLVAHCWVHSGYQNCGYQQMDSEQQAMYEAIINRPTLAAPAATDCKHQRHEWAYTIGETSPDVEICLDCGKSRSHWEQGESDWLMVDVSGLKRAAPSATDRRCGSCGGSGLAIMFGGPHRTCPACCGTGAAPAATEPDAPTDKDFDNAIAEACRVEPADKICRTCGKWEPHGRDVAVFAYCSETNKSTRYNDSCDKHEEVRT